MWLKDDISVGRKLYEECESLLMNGIQPFVVMSEDTNDFLCKYSGFVTKSYIVINGMYNIQKNKRPLNPLDPLAYSSLTTSVIVDPEGETNISVLLTSEIPFMEFMILKEV